MSSILQKDTQLVFPANIVVSASAGSGKTYTLTQRYVQFLLSDHVSNNNLRNILAITFTNLAAKEMRGKVLAYLKALAMGSERHRLEMSALVGLDEATLAQRASRLVGRILAGYSEFQVKTIDSFMVSVFKASALDFGFNPDVEIQLTNDTMIDEAFDAYGRQFGSRPEQAVVLDHLMDLLSQSREGQKRFLWDPYRVLAEEVKSLYELISSQPKPPVIDGGGQSLKALRQQIRQEASALHTMLTSLRLPIPRNVEKDLAQSMAGEIEIVLGRVLKDRVVGKLIGPIMERTYNQHREEIASALTRYNDLLREYCLVRARTYYDPYLKAIEEVRTVLDTLKHRQGKLFIHDINKMLVGNLVLDNIPEVYFRLGETIYHYMIDEFQDTAPIQWANLRPLIENSLAQGTGSLFVVGDTKQSIYGFRFADWMIMKRMMDSNGFPSATREVLTLDTNWRSDERIVEFVRTVFEDIVPLTDRAVPGSLSGLDTCGQEVIDRHKGKGYVETCWFERDDTVQPERAKIVEVISDCIARGRQLGDVAMLTPNNEDVIKVSGWLNRQNIPFVSHSSLDIRTRKVTGEVLALLQFFDSPIDDLSFSSFLLSDLFQAVLRHHGRTFSKPQVSELLFEATGEGPLYKTFQMQQADVWGTYFEDLYAKVGYLPLYDFISELYKVFDVFAVAPLQEGTLVKLLDVVKMFEESGNSSVKDFLSFALDTPEGSGWEMDVPPGGDAVTLMTIHKAKGLDFPVVIVLLYDWSNRPNPRHIMESGEGIRVLRISDKDADKVAALSQLFEEQKVKNQADDLNKLYVALTRAKEEMYVVSVFGKEGKAGRGDRAASEPSKFFPVQLPAPKPSVAKRMLQKQQSLKTFHQTIRRRYEPGGSRRSGLVEMGRGDVVHAVLAHIEYTDENIADVLDRALAKEEPTAGVSRNDIHTTLLEFLRHENVKEFFTRRPGRRVLREHEFANASGMVYRLDRVTVDDDRVTVVDFKTGADELETEYREQVLNYMAVLRDVFSGRKVRGVLAYVDMQELREVV